MASTIVRTAADALNDYQRVFKNQIIDLTYKPLQLENEIQRVRVPGGVYTPPLESLGEVIQPYQSAFTPKSTYSIDAHDIITKMIKIDFEVPESQLIAFHQKYKTEWAAIGKNPLEWSFPRYLWERMMSGKIREEIGTNSWSGVYSAPTAGTPGNSIDSVNGIAKVIADLITATTVTPVTVGALTAGTMLAKVRAFCAGLPIKVRHAPGKILMSPTRALQYAENYRDTYGFKAGNEGLENNNSRVDDYMKRIVPVIEMEGSDRFILELDAKPNLVVVEDSLFPQMPELYWIAKERSISAAATFTRGYGVEDPREFYVSDNA